MQKNLVIVESPAKAKTIEKFLGEDYKVLSSYGHIRDLKKKDLGIDLANGYTPLYEVPADKEKIVSELRAAVKKSEVVWLASDEDREGEAISWHLYEALGLDKKKYHRIAFHEITKNAILHAIENPRDINRNLVNAQQARRVLDRIVGFELSPILWRKIKPSLSAGRVQSVTVRLIIEREREIEAFSSEASYRVQAVFTQKDASNTPYQIHAELNKRLKTKQEALDFLNKLKDVHDFSVDSVVTKPAKKSPAAPFTTSTLQQEAARKLGFSVSQTMSVAQKLYESGKITYMRTDSVNLSGLAINASKDEIESAYGSQYIKIRQFSTKAKGAQEAHEAIRPTYMNAPQTTGTSQEQKLYELIWKRTIASQMADAELERTTVTINIHEGEDLKFVSSGEVITFDGFLRVYLESTDDEAMDGDENTLLPPIKTDDVLTLKESTATERFTQRPARYSEASLVRKLEELGIGRPSTYAPTISTIQNREYVEKTNIEGTDRAYNVLQLKAEKISDTVKTEKTGADKNKLKPTDTGIVVNDYLTESFPDILDYNFTANVEKEFDYVAEGEEVWTNMIDKFYKKFHPIVEEALNTHEDRKVGERVLGIDPKTGKQVSAKIGRFGPMIQLGTTEDEEKPRFASLRKEQSLANVTLEEAIKLFELPRPIGEYENKEMSASIGRFGPYIRFDGKFISLPKGADPYTVTPDEAIALIEDKRKQERERVIRIYEGEAGKEDDIQILNGRFGPYIAYQEKNYKIAKTVDASKLTLEECMHIINTTTSKTKTTGKGKAKTKADKNESKKSDNVKKTTKTTKATKTTTKKTTEKKTKATKK